ncbi:MAG: hypothetical protein GX155_08545 [Smithella sp.]|nr:hypothetical protein [Smithella sp.]
MSFGEDPQPAQIIAIMIRTANVDVAGCLIFMYSVGGFLQMCDVRAYHEAL